MKTVSSIGVGLTLIAAAVQQVVGNSLVVDGFELLVDGFPLVVS